MAQAVESSQGIRIEPARRRAAVRRKRPNARLEPCEVEALRHLGFYVILTSDLFALASGYGSNRAKTGLRGLFEKGLADRGYFCTGRTEEERRLALPTAQRGLAYKLTTDGVKRGVKEGVVNPECFSIRKRWDGRAPTDMQHRLLIIEMMIRTTLDVDAQERLCLDGEIFDFCRRNNVRMTKDEFEPGRFLCTDLTFVLEPFFGGATTQLFCEIENYKLQPSSKNKNRTTVATKIAAYSPYLKSKSRKIRGGDQDILLYVQNHPTEHLDEVIKNVDWDAVGDVRNVVRLTTFEDMREHGVLNGLWRDWRGEIVRLVE